MRADLRATIGSSKGPPRRNLPQSLWTAVQHRAVDERRTLAEVAERALRDYLRKPPIGRLKKDGRL